MSSVLVAEQFFPVTASFSAVSGFNLPSAAPPDAVAKPMVVFIPQQITPQPVTPQRNLLLPPRPCSSTPGTTATSSVSNSYSNPCLFSSSLSKLPIATPSLHTRDEAHVGWKGLFEISRTSGTSGVMGARNSSYEPKVHVDLSDSCQVEVCATAHTNAAIRRLVKSVVRGLKAEQEPEIPKEGMGGTYFFLNENGRKVAILKPCDEEPLAPNNPKGYVGRQLGDPGWKPTVRVGEAAMREVAAYLLDHEGFAKVPTSVLVRARHPVFCYNNRMSSVRASCLDLSSAAATASREPGDYEPLPMKLGSLQEFVSHECDTSEMGPSRFSTDDVHRIGILDIRLFNTDRHAGNMLVRSYNDTSSAFVPTSASHAIINSNSRELIPIDHGFCLPETLDSPYFEWLHWPQALLPFSEEELCYIRALDIEADKELLRKELPNLRPECLRVLELGTTMLKLGTEQGLNLFEIASTMTRPFGDSDEEPSELEKICVNARQAMEASAAASDDDSDCCEGARGDDEIGEEDDGDDDDDEEEEGEENDDIFIEQGMLEMDGFVASSPATTATKLPHDEFLQEDDVPHAGTRSIAARYATHMPDDAPRSPSQFTDSSSSSGGMSDLAGSSTRFCRGLGAGLAVAQDSGRLHRHKQPAVASSVCGTGGAFLHRQMKSHRHTAAQRKRHANKASKSKITSPRQAYPPPVLSADSSVVSFSDMGEEEWSAFMHTVTRHIMSALHGGKFKTCGRKMLDVAASCPRF